MQKNIDLPIEALIAFCERNQITKLSLFGSVLRDDFRPDSDVDMLVEFEPTALITFFKLVAMEMELTELVGRKVDLRTPDELSRYFRDAVVQGAELLYESTYA